MKAADNFTMANNLYLRTW